MITTGISLGYVTDSLYGFSLGATFQGSANPDAEKDAKVTFAKDQYVGGAVLSEAYLAYKIGKTNAKIGRQYISTPLVGGSGSRMYLESFQGVTVVNTDLPQTTLIAAYVDRFQARTSGAAGDTAGDVSKFKKSVVVATGSSTYVPFDGAYTLAVINKSISNLTLTAQYAIVKDVTISTKTDDVDAYYVEANYSLPVSDFKLCFDANYRGSKTGTNLDSANLEGSMYGLRAGIKDLAGFGASFAYTSSKSGDDVIGGLGNGPTTYAGTLIRGSAARTMTADTDAYLFAATYDFSKIGVAGLSVIAQYGWTDQGYKKDTATGLKGAKGTDYTNIAGAIVYAVPAVKGLTTALYYETQEAKDKSKPAGSQKKDTDELWFKAGYKF